MSDLNEVFLYGTLDDLTVRNFQGQTGEFSLVNLKLKTDSGTFHVSYDYKDMGFVDLLAKRLQESKSGGDPVQLALLPGFMEADYNKNQDKWYHKITVRASSLQLMRAPVTLDDLMPPKNKAWFSGTVKQVSPSGYVATVASEYSYYSKKEEQTVTKERHIIVKSPNVIPKNMVGKKVLGTGVPRPRLDNEWIVHVEATGLIFQN